MTLDTVEFLPHKYVLFIFIALSRAELFQSK